MPDTTLDFEGSEGVDLGEISSPAPRRKVALQALKQKQGNPGDPTYWQKYFMTSGFGTPTPSHLTDEHLWVHPVDIPAGLKNSLTREQKKNIPLVGMQIPLSDMDEEHSNWLMDQIEQARKAALSRGQATYEEEQATSPAAVPPR
jgi:hypothetical protein